MTFGGPVSVRPIIQSVIILGQIAFVIKGYVSLNVIQDAIVGVHVQFHLCETCLVKLGMIELIILIAALVDVSVDRRY